MSKEYAKKQGWKFEVWTEKELGFKNDYHLLKWSDEISSKLESFDFVSIKNKQNCKRQQKYYDKNIKNKKVTFYCNFCKEEHKRLEITYNKNVEKNGRFICIKENGSLIGKKPGKKKHNPYAIEGKKQCNLCKEIKPFTDFSPDKTKTDGHSTRCKPCRAKIYKEKYHIRKKKKNNH